MDVRKEAGVGAGQQLDGDALALINRFSRKELTAEEVYAFSVRLCDNEVDRDGERFGAEALEELARRFVGKSGVFDHDWSAKGQTARIYRAEALEEPGRSTAAGDGLRYVKGYAYMLRTEGNRDLIAEIEGGIKKEVSVGCAVEKSICSVCGNDMNDRDACRHVKGRTYNGKLCWGELTGVTDAYEWSFVAVPAQREAGVIKTYGGQGWSELKKELAQRPECLARLGQLEKEAELGRRYLADLRREVARLGGLAEPGVDRTILAGIVDKLEEGELRALRKSYEVRVAQRFPVEPQLTYREEEKQGEQRDGAFLI